MSLADQLARDRFIGEHGKNFCVAASAGAGKTTAIVSRIAQIACDPVPNAADDPLPRLVVVTYTNLAAEELRVRARIKLLDHLVQNPAGSEQLLGRFGKAYFGTIHSFCLKLIQEHGRMLGLPARAELLDDQNQDRLWQRFVQSPALEASVGNSEGLDAVLRHMSFQQLLTLASAMQPGEAEHTLKHHQPGEAPVIDLEPVLSYIATNNRATVNVLAFQKILDEWRDALAAGDLYLPLPKVDKGGAEFVALAAGALRPYSHWLGRMASVEAARLCLAFRDYRRDAGLLSYDDMIYWARLLLDTPSVRKRLLERKLIILLDEAQDTDGPMFQILAELTRPSESVPFSWPGKGAPPEPGRFCFVGDDQQSIYSSRSDLSVYQSYVGAYREKKGGELLEFSVTMRCPVDVIHAVNAVFPERIKQQHLEFRKLHARPEAPAGRFRILDLPPPDEALKKTADRFEWECRQTAAWLAAEGLEGLGLSRWDELAVLCPRTGWLAEASAIFREQGLPCRLISRRQQRRDLPSFSWPVMVLHAVLHPTDRFELIGVLREIFAVSDTELAAAQRRDEEGLSLFTALGDGSRLDAALALLRGLREQMEALPLRTVSRCADLVWQGVSLKERLETLELPTAPLEWLRHQAMSAEADGTGLSEWTADMVRDLQQPPPELPGSEAAIQFLTCHKSKGLEWPVVLVLGLAHEIRDASSGYPRIERSGGGFQVFVSDHAKEENRSEAIQIAREEELQRLFYVTMTRAKRQLIVPDSLALYPVSEKGKTPNFAKITGWDEVFAEAPQEPMAAAAAVSSTIIAPVAETVLRPAAALDLGAAQKAAASFARRIVPHQLAVHEPLPEEVRTDSGPFTIGVGGIDYGLWWHETLEFFPWKSDRKGIDAYVQERLATLQPEDPTRVRAMKEIELLLAGTLCTELGKECDAVLSEIQFAFPSTPETYIEGVIDLVAVGKDGELVLIDWKTNRPYDGEASASYEARIAGIYAGQLKAYAAVLSQGLGKTVKKTGVYLTPTGKFVPTT
jgi:ATP-dependent helicase/nuclease subunit A